MMTCADADELASEILELATEELELATEELELLERLLIDEGLLLAALEFKLLELEIPELEVAALETLELAAVLVTLAELTAAAELFVVGVLLELPPPPHAVSKRLNVRNETRLRLRMMTPLLLCTKSYGQLHHEMSLLVYMLKSKKC
jgi:hypothetical protein